jgi:hypothetical protein
VRLPGNAAIVGARDRKQSEVLTRERLNCPFGPSDGPWFAWRWRRRIAWCAAGGCSDVGVQGHQAQAAPWKKRCV